MIVMTKAIKVCRHAGQGACNGCPAAKKPAKPARQVVKGGNHHG